MISAAASTLPEKQETTVLLEFSRTTITGGLQVHEDIQRRRRGLRCLSPVAEEVTAQPADRLAANTEVIVAPILGRSPAPYHSLAIPAPPVNPT